jgi:hypothetical protein
MKVLLDNCVDWRVKRLLAIHSVVHCKDVGWENLSNGKLLAAASEAGFEAMITVDKKLKYEQNLDRLPLTVIEIDTPDSRLPSITAISESLNNALAFADRFRFISVDHEGRIVTKAEI